MYACTNEYLKGTAVRPPLVASHASADGCAERRRRETIRCASCAGGVMYDRVDGCVACRRQVGVVCCIGRSCNGPKAFHQGTFDPRADVQPIEYYRVRTRAGPHRWRCSVRDQTLTPLSPPRAGGCRLHVVGCTLYVAHWALLHAGGGGGSLCSRLYRRGLARLSPARPPARPPASTHGVWVHRVRRPCDRQVLDVQHTTAHVHRKACSLQRATRSRRHTCKTYQTTENMQHATRSTQHATCAERTVR